ncbi:MAG: NADH-quinone oxidoreductase subunit A [Deltaproteobacteria bacterium]|nr:NADH-quinone oxidoreductase subunit A [Deltaproteobacteria bacterium]
MVLCTGLALAILIANAVLGPKRRGGMKDEPFECGSPQADDPRKRVSVRFYAVAILFVVFDIEAVFLFPWAVLYRELLASPVLGVIALAEILLFVGILAVGLWWVWGKGALEWAFDAPPGKTEVAGGRGHGEAKAGD